MCSIWTADLFGAWGFGLLFLMWGSIFFVWFCACTLLDIFFGSDDGPDGPTLDGVGYDGMGHRGDRPGGYHYYLMIDCAGYASVLALFLWIVLIHL